MLVNVILVLSLSHYLAVASVPSSSPVAHSTASQSRTPKFIRSSSSSHSRQGEAALYNFKHEGSTRNNITTGCEGLRDDMGKIRKVQFYVINGAGVKKVLEPSAFLPVDANSQQVQVLEKRSSTVNYDQFCFPIECGSEVCGFIVGPNKVDGQETDSAELHFQMVPAKPEGSSSNSNSVEGVNNKPSNENENEKESPTIIIITHNGAPAPPPPGNPVPPTTVPPTTVPPTTSPPTICPPTAAPPTVCPPSAPAPPPACPVPAPAPAPVPAPAYCPSYYYTPSPAYCCPSPAACSPTPSPSPPPSQGSGWGAPPPPPPPPSHGHGHGWGLHYH